jgi:hypothetical protein
MPKPRVYVETTIPNFYYDFRKSPAITMRREATRQWWQVAAPGCELLTSTFVHDELAAGTSGQVVLRLALLAQVPAVAFVPQVAEIVRYYVLHKLMPAKPPHDALHLALASYYKCDFILTWNCRHLANPNKVGHIQRINARLGLHVPRLVTPLDLLQGEFDE